MVAALVERIAKLFPSDQIMRGDGQVYMRRFYVAQIGSRHIRFHQILLSDDDRFLHDHPWGFVSLMLSGRYTEFNNDGQRVLRAPRVNLRRARDLHRLVVNEPVWTFVVTGRKVRDWGFVTDAGWQPWWEYESDGDVTSRVSGRLFGRA